MRNLKLRDPRWHTPGRWPRQRRHAVSARCSQKGIACRQCRCRVKCRRTAAAALTASGCPLANAASSACAARQRCNCPHPTLENPAPGATGRGRRGHYRAAFSPGRPSAPRCFLQMLPPGLPSSFAPPIPLPHHARHAPHAPPYPWLPCALRPQPKRPRIGARSPGSGA